MPLSLTALNCCLLPLAIMTVSGTAGAADEREVPWLEPCADGRALSIDELYAYCGVPGHCSRPVICAQRRCRVNGFIDPVNIWDKQRHPWLPDSKFLLFNAAQDLNLEVRVVAREAPRLFQTLARQADDWDGAAVVTGTLVSLDLPMMAGCRRALVLNLSAAASLVLGEDGDAPVDPK